MDENSADHDAEETKENLVLVEAGGGGGGEATRV